MSRFVEYKYTGIRVKAPASSSEALINPFLLWFMPEYSEETLTPPTSNEWLNGYSEVAAKRDVESSLRGRGDRIPMGAECRRASCIDFCEHVKTPQVVEANPGAPTPESAKIRVML